MKNENTIYVRPTTQAVYGGFYRFEAMVKAKGEGAIVGGVSREDAIRAGGQVLWALNKWGAKNWKTHGAIDEQPDVPSTFDYPVVDEE